MRAASMVLVVGFALALVPTAAAEEPCGSGEVVDVGGLGLAYLIFEADGSHCLAVESNGVAGLQCEREHPDPDTCVAL